MSRSRIGAVMREERQRLRWTQQDLVKEVNVHRSMISDWELGAALIPQHMACKIVKALGSHKLRAQVCYECEVSPLSTPYLDLVDQHPVVVISVLAEELEEAKVALLALKLNNKRTDSDLAPRDREAMEHAAEQLIDLIAGINTLFASWQQWYVFDEGLAAHRHREKLYARGYASRPICTAWA